jgi:hypothetical protein
MTNPVSSAPSPGGGSSFATDSANLGLGCGNPRRAQPNDRDVH